MCIKKIPTVYTVQYVDSLQINSFVFCSVHKRGYKMYYASLQRKSEYLQKAPLYCNANFRIFMTAQKMRMHCAVDYLVKKPPNKSHEKISCYIKIHEILYRTIFISFSC